MAFANLGQDAFSCLVTIFLRLVFVIALHMANSERHSKTYRKNPSHFIFSINQNTPVHTSHMIEMDAQAEMV